jgi:hypothetical protein
MKSIGGASFVEKYHIQFELHSAALGPSFSGSLELVRSICKRNARE